MSGFSDVHYSRLAAAAQGRQDHQAQRDHLLQLRMQEHECSAFHPRNRGIAVGAMQSVPPLLAEAIAAEIFKARIATSNQQAEIQSAYAKAGKMLDDWLEDECAGQILERDDRQIAAYAAD